MAARGHALVEGLRARLAAVQRSSPARAVHESLSSSGSIPRSPPGTGSPTWSLPRVVRRSRPAPSPVRRHQLGGDRRGRARPRRRRAVRLPPGRRGHPGDARPRRAAGGLPRLGHRRGRHRGATGPATRRRRRGTGLGAAPGGRTTAPRGSRPAGAVTPREAVALSCRGRAAGRRPRPRARPSRRRPGRRALCARCVGSPPTSSRAAAGTGAGAGAEHGQQSATHLAVGPLVRLTAAHGPCQAGEPASCHAHVRATGQTSQSGDGRCRRARRAP